jgi:hypothetical protein
MSNNVPDPAYWHRVDAVVNLSNEQCGAVDPNEVGASTLFAAARFNAFILAKTTGSAANMTIERNEALDYYTGQFRKMMAANLEDFIQNFDKYMKPGAQ